MEAAAVFWLSGLLFTSGLVHSLDQEKYLGDKMPWWGWFGILSAWPWLLGALAGYIVTKETSGD